MHALGAASCIISAASCMSALPHLRVFARHLSEPRLADHQNRREPQELGFEGDVERVVRVIALIISPSGPVLAVDCVFFGGVEGGESVD